MQLDVQSYTSEMNIQDMLSKLDQVEDSTQSLSQNNVLRHKLAKQEHLKIQTINLSMIILKTFISFIHHVHLTGLGNKKLIQQIRNSLIIENCLDEVGGHRLLLVQRD